MPCHIIEELCKKTKVVNLEVRVPSEPEKGGNFLFRGGDSHRRDKERRCFQSKEWLGLVGGRVKLR